MSDPLTPVVDSWKAALRTNGVRAFDETPAGAAYPYVALDQVQVIPEDDECSSGSETILTFKAWSDRLDYAEVSGLVRTCRVVLRDDLVIVGHSVVLQEFGDVLYRKDPATGHASAVMTLRLETEPV